MRGLDDTDREILDLLLADGRRPYSDIAAAVDLSPPAVSDRVDRLQEMGLIRGFTVDIDRSLLRGGVPILLDVTVRPGRTAAVADPLSDTEAVEHVFRTADGRVLATLTVSESEVESLLAETVDLDDVREYEAHLLADRSWQPSVGAADLAPACDECGNTVTTEGETVRLDGDRYEFCCSSCKSQFVERYERLKEGA
jgi:DNA-binding Lrp family transcriptional regulator